MKKSENDGIYSPKEFLEASADSEPSVGFYTNLDEQEKNIVQHYMEAYTGYFVSALLGVDPRDLDDEISKLLN